MSVAICLQTLGKVLGLMGTLLYREMLKRNTVRPMKAIIREPRAELQRKMLRQWTRTKSRESSYIQLAVCSPGRSIFCSAVLTWCHLQGGFLFTTVVSCLQWPGTQNGHWSAAASFYACQLLAFVAIVTGSQQMLVLPGERPHESDEEFDTSTGLDSKERHDREGKEFDKQYLQAVVRRLRDTRHDDRPNPLLVFALQAPIMLLTLSFMAYLAGLCSVIFAPLALQPVWGDNAKVRLTTPPSSITSQPVGTDCGLFRRNWFCVYRCFRHCLFLGAQTIQLAA